MPAAAVCFVVIGKAGGFVILAPGDGFMKLAVAAFPYEVGTAGISTWVLGFKRHGRLSLLSWTR